MSQNQNPTFYLLCFWRLECGSCLNVWATFSCFKWIFRNFHRIEWISNGTIPRNPSVTNGCVFHKSISQYFFFFHFRYILSTSGWQCVVSHLPCFLLNTVAKISLSTIRTISWLFFFAFFFLKCTFILCKHNFSFTLFLCIFRYSHVIFKFFFVFFL